MLTGAVVALALIASLQAQAAAQEPGSDPDSGSYPDVPSEAYYTVHVSTLAQAGVFAGTECEEGFCPRDRIDRRTMAVWVVRVLDGQDPPAVPETRFNDVDAAGFYAPFIERMAELGVTTGCGDHSGFCPDGKVTRAHMAVFLSRAYKLPAARDPGFADVPADAWYASDVAKLAASRISLGCGDGSGFCPDLETTRGQTAAFLARAIAWQQDPSAQGSLETVDYEQINDLLATVGTLDAARDCADPSAPSSLDDRVEVIRIADGCVLIEYEQLDGRTLAEARRDLARDPAVVAVDIPIVDLELTQDYAGDDPDAGRQWHLPQVDARRLWEGWPEGASVTVAVIDSGVDSTHEDLDDNVVIAGNACHGRDLESHGTHVAGIASAESGNQFAVAGIAPKARVMPIKLPMADVPYDPDCAQEVWTLPQAIRIAVENGADVINMSLGLVRHESQPFPTTWEVAIHLATTSNVVMVAAAGNRGRKFSNRNAPEIPAMHSDVISVAAATRSGRRAPFSTSNRWVNIAAPGVEILSTVPCAGGSCGTGLKDGTSMAAPVVTGVVAHMKARFPDATPAQVRQALYETALQPGSTRPGVRTNDLGWGIIQPRAAIEALGRSLGVDNATPQFTSPTERAVAENTTRAGAVTAIDEDDAVVDYDISGGADRDLFTVNSAGDLRFGAAPDYEMPADADGDNVYEVTVTATSGFGTRTSDVAQSLLVTVTDIDEPPAAPAAPVLGPAARSMQVSWSEPENAGPPIDDYDVQYRTVEAADDTLGTREWTQVGRDLWNVGCDVWRDLGDPGRDVWDDLWGDAGNAGREIGDAIGDRMLKGADDGAGWDDFWNIGCDVWRDLGDIVWGPIWDVGEDFLDAIAKAFADWFEAAGAAGRGIGSAIGDIAGAVGDVVGVVGDVVGVVGDVVGGIGGFFGGLFALDATDWTTWTSWSHTDTSTAATITGLDDDDAYQVRVRASSQEGSGDWSEPSTARTVANTGPRFTSPTTFEIREPATAVGVVTATDADAQDSVRAYQISGGADAARLRINSSTGALSFTAATDFENPADADGGNDYEVTVTAVSGEGSRLLTAAQAVTVTVTDDTGDALAAPQAPPEPRLVNASETTLTVEWQRPAVTGGAITGYDVRYRAGRTGAWANWPHGGTVRRAAISGLADNTRYEVQVRAINRTGASDWSASLLAATSGNQAPQFVSPASVSVEENTRRAIRIRAVDQDARDTVSTYGLTSGVDQALFEIDGAGYLAFKSAPDYDEPADANGDNAYVVAVAATSGSGERIRTATQTITITVVDDTAEAPATVAATYAYVGDTVVVSWDPVPDADYYKVYYDDFFSDGCTVRGSRASFCDLLAANVTAATYTHTDPADDGDNYYWVTACNSSGCSPVQSDSPATTVGAAPATVAATYAYVGDTVVVSWDPVPDADYYKVYYDDFFSDGCTVSGSRASFCDLLAANVTAATYTHTDPADDGDNYYWVTACNSSGCSPVQSDSPATTVGAAPATVAATYAYVGDTVVVSWDPVPDADYYKVYYDDFFSDGCTVRGSRASFCDLLAANVTAATYTHTDPADDGDNYYWVTACNSSGCSPVQSDSPATTVGAAPATVAATYAYVGDTVVVSWDPVPDADYYKVYYDDFFSDGCTVRGSRASFCDLLAANVTAATYTHTDPADDGDNYYWVTACNSSGCSPVQSDSPATTVGAAPATVAATYAYVGDTVVVSWDPVPDADYYKVYYDDFFSDGCTVRGSRASFCDLLAANVTAATYTHTDPADDGDNYYWVTACNSSGCSPVQSDSPATTVGAAPATVAATYAYVGDTVVVSWDPVPDADYYKVYYDDFFSDGCTVRGSRASFCDLLAANVTAATYTHTDPADDGDNYYWVTACNSSGCSPVQSDSPATTVGAAPATVAATYAYVGDTVVVSWDPVPDADYYKVYYDDFFSDGCTVSGSRASFCDLLAANVTAATYTHTDPADDGDNYYWVTACNSSGCSPVQSDSPATTVGAAPATVAATYAYVGDTVVVSWDPVPDADYYKVYYDDFFSDGCTVRGSRASFCDLLAANVTAATYTHTDPADDGDNYYWVTACNSSGCSPVQSDSPATTVGAAPATVAATYAYVGDTVVVSWDPVPDADYYKVYYDDFFSDGCTVSGSRASFCDLLAANVTAATYTHTDPADDGDNYYWVTACNSSGCSPVQSDSPATTVGAAPATVAATYAYVGDTVDPVSWDPVPDADYYKVYYDDFFSDGCTVRGSRASFCDLLAANVTAATYTHTDPADDGDNYYWVTACNSSGCSPVQSDSPATTVGAAPATVAATYAYVVLET